MNRLNVVYQGIETYIELTTSMAAIQDLYKAIVREYQLSVPYFRILLFDEQRRPITKLKQALNLGTDYYGETDQMKHVIVDLSVISSDNRVLHEIDVNTLVRPVDVQLPDLELTPLFTATEGWLDNVVAKIRQQLVLKDGPERVKPMALARCSRGGKTRALKEIAHELRRQLPEACVIYISLNDNTKVYNNDQLDPVGAICKRIAFSASNLPQDAANFEPYYEKVVNVKNLITWLGDCTRILLIDELNLLESFVGLPTEASRECANFLRSQFLVKSNQYFVFSSHVATAINNLSSYMDSQSARTVISQQLPTIPSFQIALKNLHCYSYTPRDILKFGCIPALIHTEVIQCLTPRKLQEAIEKYFTNEQQYDDLTVYQLLGTFIDGNFMNVPQSFWQFMDTYTSVFATNNVTLVVQWIPVYMIDILKGYYSYGKNQLSDRCSKIIKSITNCFETFFMSQEKSGEGWQFLFVTVLLIRCASGNLVSPLLLDFQTASVYSDCSVSYNHLEHPTIPQAQLKTVDQVIEGLVIPQNVPHIDVIHPQHAQFVGYDVMVIFYDQKRHRTIYGYQLKEGKSTKYPAVHKLITKSFFVEGVPNLELSTKKQWIKPGLEELKHFFGLSGCFWTPMYWNQMFSDVNIVTQPEVSTQQSISYEEQSSSKSTQKRDKRSSPRMQASKRRK